MFISIADILSRRFPDKHFPRFFVRYIEHILHQDEMNAILACTGNLEGEDFIHAVLDELGVRVRVEHKERIPQTKSPLVFVSNHPLGGVDGMVLLWILNENRGGRVKAIVNDFLMNVTPLKELFVPVNKVGGQCREYAQKQRELWESDCDVLTFPAGACSRRQEGGVIADLPWRDTFIRRAKEYGRDVVPIWFEGQNSRFFYNLAYWRKKFGIRMNIEMLFLVDEMFKARGKEFVVHIGHRIPYGNL